MKVKLRMELEVSEGMEAQVRAWLTTVAEGAQGLGRLDTFSAEGLPERPASLGGAVVKVREAE